MLNMTWGLKRKSSIAARRGKRLTPNVVDLFQVKGAIERDKPTRLPAILLLGATPCTPALSPQHQKEFIFLLITIICHSFPLFHLMALSFVSPPPPRPSRRSPFSLSAFSSFTPISPVPPTPTSCSEQWPQLQPSTPDSIQDSTTTVSEYSTPLTAPQQPDSPSVPAWKAVPPTPPSFIPLSSSSRLPSRRRSHPRPASAILLGTRTAAAQRRLSLPTRPMRTPSSTGPPSAFLTHQRCSSLGSAARRLFHIAGDDAASDDGDDPVTEPDRSLSPVEDEVIPKRSAPERHHALLELLVSERNYLVELRTLVNVRFCLISPAC